MMKKRIPLLLALLVLTSCGGETAPTEKEVLPDGLSAVSKAISLPETKPILEGISAPAEVTEGCPPVADYDLAGVPRDPQSGEDLYVSGNQPVLLAETPEGDAALYALPGRENADEETNVLLQWGDSLAEFDWPFGTPRGIPPWMVCADLDNDGEDELIVDCYWGSGTGVSVEALHVVEKTPGGALTAYTLPESLWRERLPALFHTAELDGRTFAVLGRELVEFEADYVDLETASAGSIAGFSPEGWSGLAFRGAFCLSPKDSPAPCCVAETSAAVTYQDGVFTLQNFHLYSYEQ